MWPALEHGLVDRGGMVKGTRGPGSGWHPESDKRAVTFQIRSDSGNI